MDSTSRLEILRRCLSPWSCRPLTQLNTPYPSIAYLARSLRRRGVDCELRDLGIELVLRLFCGAGLQELFDELEGIADLPGPARRALAMRARYEATVEPVIAFLQGRDGSLAQRIVDGPFLPCGPRFETADLSAFGPMGGHDAARYLATLYLADIADLITECVDEGFALARYHAHLATAAESFDPLWDRLGRDTLVDRHLDALADTLSGEVVGLSVPFPGNLYGALRIGRRLKERGVYVVMGGGYINTELRECSEERLWSCVDAMTYDDGEGPLWQILQEREGHEDKRHRTRLPSGLMQHECSDSTVSIAADYRGLQLDHYLQTIDTLNPAHRLWADGRWNKITLAHGCYWRRCTFCDVNLDYIARYQPARATELVDEIERLVEETGQRGFHFVDEAAPPKLLREVALELLARNVQISLWGNIRFEKSYDSDLCRLLAQAGLIAVTAGLEVANDRLLKLIDKGTTVEQVARVARAFGDAGVLVHGYLMYGFPTQSEGETVDSMELVRQLFQCGLLHSGFWHRFVLTRHAPIFQRPGDFAVELVPLRRSAFAQNDIPHRDPEGADHDRFDAVLPLALQSWLRGEELDRPVHTWFEDPISASGESPTRIADCLARPMPEKRRGRLLWTGGTPERRKAGYFCIPLTGKARCRERMRSSVG